MRPRARLPAAPGPRRGRAQHRPAARGALRLYHARSGYRGLNYRDPSGKDECVDYWTTTTSTAGGSVTSFTATVYECGGDGSGDGSAGPGPGAPAGPGPGGPGGPGGPAAPAPPPPKTPPVNPRACGVAIGKAVVSGALDAALLAAPAARGIGLVVQLAEDYRAGAALTQSAISGTVARGAIPGGSLAAYAAGYENRTIAVETFRAQAQLSPGTLANGALAIAKAGGLALYDGLASLSVKGVLRALPVTGTAFLIGDAVSACTQ